MESSTSYQIHPRRLFCATPPPPASGSGSGVDSSSCVRPSIIAKQERMLNSGQPPLLAPSPSSPAVLRTHVETRLLDADVDILVSYISEIKKCVASPLSPSVECDALSLNNLAPIREALTDLVKQVQQETETIFVSTPKLKSSAEISKQAALMMTDSRLLSADMAHLRTIQKEVRGLGLGLNLDLPRSPSPQTAAKISRLLAQSPEHEQASTQGLTLSPGSEILFERSSNAWFTTTSKRRSGSLPPPAREDADVRTDSPISTIAPISTVIANREILASDESLTVSALQAAMVRRRAPSGTNHLVAWMRKQAKRSTSNRAFPESSIYRN